jgi:hypothetical protein
MGGLTVRYHSATGIACLPPYRKASRCCSMMGIMLCFGRALERSPNGLKQMIGTPPAHAANRSALSLRHITHRSR